MKYLIFSRPFTRKFTNLYKKILLKPSEEIFYISDFKFKDDVNLIERQYQYIDSLSDAECDSNTDLDDVIARCRYLRNINKTLAKKLAISARLAIEEILAEFRPDFYIGLPIDNYILHLMHVACNKYGVKNISPVQSFIPNKTRITSLGEWVKVREVDQCEIEECYKKITEKSFKPTWLKSHRSLPILAKLYIKERLKKIYFEMQKIKNNDPYSFHYNTIYPAKGVISIDSVTNVLAYKKFESISATERLLEESKSYQKLVYLPLQFSPETTIDYYIKDNRFGQYDRLMKEVLNAIPSNVVLIVKEHPDLYGFRNIKFYDAFLNNKNVHLAPVDFPTSKILKSIDAVVVTGGGSTGAEAIVRGIPTLSLGGCFYSGSESLSITDFERVAEWAAVLLKPAPTISERKIVVKRILENTVEGPYDFVRSSMQNNSRDIANLKEIISILQ